MIINYEAGPDLDAAIALVVGLPGEVVNGRFMCRRQALKDWRHEGKEQTCEGLAGFDFWEPSTDLNAAFEAAERVDLFSGHLLGKCAANRKAWHIRERVSDQNYVAVGVTAAETICRAILALKA